jgi:hypothetical protein
MHGTSGIQPHRNVENEQENGIKVIFGIIYVRAYLKNNIMLKIIN